MPVPELKTVIQRMIDAGESPDNIKQVIRDYNQKYPVMQASPADNNYSQPFGESVDAIAKGAWDAVSSGRAAEAMTRGGLGWLKGGLLDAPGALWEGAKGTVNMALHPWDTIAKGVDVLQNPGEYLGKLGDIGQGMLNTTMQSGSPEGAEAFGRMTGNLTGIPAATAIATKKLPVVVPPVARTVGRGLTAAGEVMEQSQPLSGMFPRMVEPRVARTVEKAAGRGLQAVGKAMQPTPVEVLPPTVDFGIPKKSGSVVDVPESVPPSRGNLNPSNTIYGEQGNPPYVPTPDSAETRVLADIAARMQGGTSQTVSKMQEAADIMRRMAPERAARSRGLPESPVSFYAEGPNPWEFDVQSPTASRHFNSPVEPHPLKYSGEEVIPESTPKVPQGTTSKTLELKKGKSSTELLGNQDFMEKMHSQGFKFMGINKGGNYYFQR